MRATVAESCVIVGHLRREAGRRTAGLVPCGGARMRVAARPIGSRRPCNTTIKPEACNQFHTPPGDPPRRCCRGTRWMRLQSIQTGWRAHPCLPAPCRAAQAGAGGWTPWYCRCNAGPPQSPRAHAGGGKGCDPPCGPTLRQQCRLLLMALAHVSAWIASATGCRSARSWACSCGSATLLM